MEIGNRATSFRRLVAEYRDLVLDPPDGIIAGPISESNFYQWEALLAGPADTIYEGGVYLAKISFPKDYPLNPPTVKFTCPLFHPNVYPDGLVCISILHAPGEDPNIYEHPSERWSPVQSVEKILLSIISILAEPNHESSANVDASRLWRSDRNKYNEIVTNEIQKFLHVP